MKSVFTFTHNMPLLAVLSASPSWTRSFPFFGTFPSVCHGDWWFSSSTHSSSWGCCGCWDRTCVVGGAGGGGEWSGDDSSKFDARCVFVFTFISLFQYYTHLHLHQGDERYWGYITDETPIRASTNLWTTTVLGNTRKYSTWVWDNLGISPWRLMFDCFNNPLHPPKTDMKMEKITMFSLNQRYSTSSNCCFFQPVIFVFRSISDGIGSWRFWGIWTLKNRNNQKQLIYTDVATTSHLFLYTRACSLRLPQKVGFTHMNTYDILYCTKNV